MFYLIRLVALIGSVVVTLIIFDSIALLGLPAPEAQSVLARLALAAVSR